MAYKGKFRASNPSKYKGDASKITYRSRWELVVMQNFDHHPDVLEWSSEEIVIPYISPLDNKRHRYFPDFYVKRKGKDGNIACYLIEVKPLAQTKPPKVSNQVTRKYLNEVATWGVNSAKWQMAESYCKERNWTFIKITEKELGLF